MYPGTQINWHDNSVIDTNNTIEVANDAPLFMQVFSADKGTEDIVEISGSNFDAMYGTMSFDKHGQSAIQAKNIIDAGGRLLAKRVVAKDSTLANVVLCAVVKSAGSGVSVKWESKSIENVKTFAEVKAAAEDMYDEAEGVYPLIICTDNGRGVSKKAIRLNPDYATSKTIGKTLYSLVIYEGTTIIEQTTVSFDPTVIYNNNAYRLDEYTNTQVSGKILDDIFELYAAKIADEVGQDIDVIRTYDIIYGYTNRGSVLEGFALAEDSIDLDSATGITLEKGSNGNFGNAPAGTQAWADEIKEVFTGAFSDEIWDVDTYKIAAVVDANYPDDVKKAIYDFVTFRKDCVFLRDFGIDNVDTFLGIKARYEDFVDQRNRFVSDYCTTYLVQDPTTRKNIKVTMTYDFAAVLVNHIINNPYAPVAGVVNGFILPNAIKGSINFTPVNTPSVNQKEAMDEIKVNYAIFEDDNCVVQSCYTSQEKYTQLSYLNNILAIQRVLRAVRTACPKQRYSLSTGSDLTSYANAVNNVLANYTSNFSTLNFKYTQDDLKTSQKIFYASIEFAFLNWAQTEIFDIYAINN